MCSYCNGTEDLNNFDFKIKGWLVGWLVFYGISILVGYLVPNSVIYDLYVNSLLITLLLNKWLELICLHTFKWFQVLLFHMSNSIYQVFLSNTNNLNTDV